MQNLTRDLSVLWTPDLTVGSATMDERNRAALVALSQVGAAIAGDTGIELRDWLLDVMDQIDYLLVAEEGELAEIGYPELSFHQQLHDRARSITRAARSQTGKASSKEARNEVARDACATLSVWLMRHIQDADKLFFPYIDIRYRDVALS
jgi:hemerythrin-like metal-binding protein